MNYKGGVDSAGLLLVGVTKGCDERNKYRRKVSKFSYMSLPLLRIMLGFGKNNDGGLTFFRCCINFGEIK